MSESRQVNPPSLPEYRLGETGDATPLRVSDENGGTPNGCSGHHISRKVRPYVYAREGDESSQKHGRYAYPPVGQEQADGSGEGERRVVTRERRIVGSRHQQKGRVTHKGPRPRPQVDDQLVETKSDKHTYDGDDGSDLPALSLIRGPRPEPHCDEGGDEQIRPIVGDEGQKSI